MTPSEFQELFIVLDNVWGGLDEGREAGYRWLLADEDYELVQAAVRELATGVDRRDEDLKWLPRAPEIAVRVRGLARERAHEEWLQRRLDAIRRHVLAAGEAP